jgi:bifunctional non-homologous end joining protein LigD
VRITHPDRVMYPEPRLTKLDIARYYDRVADAMMPHVDGRPAWRSLDHSRKR